MRNWKSLGRALMFFAAAWTLIISSMACNTMEGVGQDTERAGEKLQDAARDAKD